MILQKIIASNTLKYIGYASLIGLVLFLGFKFKILVEQATAYEFTKQELELNEAEMNILVKELDDMENRFNEQTTVLNKLSNATLELEKSNDLLLEKQRSHDYKKINEKKPKLAEKIYEKSLNEYYNTYYDCVLCDNNGTDKEGNNPN